MKNKIANSIIFIAIAFGVGFFIKDIPLEKIIKFFDSNFFVAVIAAIVGTSAIYLYITQKNDKKRDAANIVLMEIRHAEKMIDQIRGGGTIEMLQTLLLTNKWSKYNYLFIEDLDRDELDLINNFYNQCSLIDNSLTQLSISYQLKQKSDHIHNALADLAIEEIKLSGNLETFQIKAQKFLQIMENFGYKFNPLDPQQKIISALGNIQKITTSPAGNTLKKIAKLK